MGGVCLPLPDAGAGVDHDEPAAHLEDDYGERDRHEGSWQARPGEGCLRLIDADTFDEGGVMRLAPDPVIDGGDLDRADLVAVESDGGLDRSVGTRRRGEFDRAGETKRCGGGRCGKEAPAVDLEHYVSPSCYHRE